MGSYNFIHCPESRSVHFSKLVKYYNYGNISISKQTVPAVGRLSASKSIDYQNFNCILYTYTHISRTLESTIENRTFSGED